MNNMKKLKFHLFPSGNLQFQSNMKKIENFTYFNNWQNIWKTTSSIENIKNIYEYISYDRIIPTYIISLNISILIVELF